MKKIKPINRLLAFLVFLTMTLSGIVPADIVYATEKIENINEKEENVTEEAATENLCGCVLDDGLTVFDAWEQSVPQVSAYAATETNAQEAVRVVNEIVVFIRFADEPADIYEQRGGLDYIMSMYNGAANSLEAYMDEFSWGKADADTYFWPQEADGTPICYVDDHPVSYYMKKSDTNPNGYTSSQEYSRRMNLLNNAVNFMGDDFLEELGIEGQPYNLVFMVPDCENWNDLLWSHKSSIQVNGKYQTYNLITYASKSDITRTITHEFMHSYGFPDMYHYYNNSGNVGSPEPLSLWSIMAYTGSDAGHPTVYEKYRYGHWISSNDAIQTITKSGHYVLGPSVANQSDNTIAYKIPIEGDSNQYFMLEYRGSSDSSFDASLNREGLIFYRVDSRQYGNSYGPPDEVFVLREGNDYVSNAYYNGNIGRKEFSEFKLYNDETDKGIRVYNIKKENGKMSFDIKISYATLNASKQSPVSMADSKNVVLSTEPYSAEDGYTFRFGTIIDGKEYELSGGYQSKNSITVNFLSALKNKAVGTHTLFVDVKNTATGEIIRATCSDYVIEGMQVSHISTNVASPQTVGTTIQLFTSVNNEDVEADNIHKFIVEKDGEEEELTMNGDYSANWTPTEAGIYTIKYIVEDSYGMSASKEIQYMIGSDTSAYILYNNNSWNNAYIHYKVGNGAWTEVPGVQMLKCDSEGYSWVYLIDLKKQSGTVCFNNGNGSWDSNGGKNYTITAGVNSFGGKDAKLSSIAINATDLKKGLCQFKLDINGGILPYNIEYVVKDKNSGNVIDQSKGMSYSDSEYTIYSAVRNTGEYTLSVTLTDAYGQTVSQEKSFELKPFTMTDIKTSVPSPQKAGTTIKLTEEHQNPYIYKYGLSSNWTITNKTTGTVETKIAYYSSTIDWTPTENGEYEIKADMTDHAGEKASYTINYTIADKITNSATIYYANGSWNKAYIHFKTTSGEWTTVPGELMATSSEQNGYTWKYTIELGEDNGATVCFNNGNGSWDSRNGSNYAVGVGTFGVKNGTVTELKPVVTIKPTATPTVKPTTTATPTATPTAKPTATPTVKPTATPTATPTPIVENTATIYYANSSWSQAYIHYKVGDGAWTTVPGVPMEANKDKDGYTWKYVIDLKNAKDATICFNNGNNAWDSKNGSNYSVAAGVYGIKNGVQNNLGEVVTDKVVTVYYNTGWNQPYILYCLEKGSWINNPGIAMTATSEKAGYTHKAVINLGDSTYLKACFNNGAGSWDSKNGINYTLQPGVYGVSNGNVYQLN